MKRLGGSSLNRCGYLSRAESRRRAGRGGRAHVGSAADGGPAGGRGGRVSSGGGCHLIPPPRTGLPHERGPFPTWSWDANDCWWLMAGWRRRGRRAGGAARSFGAGVLRQRPRARRRAAAEAAAAGAGGSGGAAGRRFTRGPRRGRAAAAGGILRQPLLVAARVNSFEGPGTTPTGPRSRDSLQKHATDAAGRLGR